MQKLKAIDVDRQKLIGVLKDHVDRFQRERVSAPDLLPISRNSTCHNGCAGRL
jgi:hypothetical protein